MVFSYYTGLPRSGKAIYRKSDAISEVDIGATDALQALLGDLESGLASEDRLAVTRVLQQLSDALVAKLDLPPVRIRVLSNRPATDYEELQGLYEPAQDTGKARISLWMRTARRRQVVAFQTFLRTLLHEFCHHLDYEYYGFAESYHTEGFFKREAHLFRQLMRETD